MLNLVHSTRNRLRPVNYFLEFLSVQIHVKGSVTSIRYCSIFKVLPVCFSADSLFSLPQTRELVKHFFQGFSAALFGFVGRSVERSNIILQPRTFVNPFFTKNVILFLSFFSGRKKGRIHVVSSLFFPFIPHGGWGDGAGCIRPPPSIKSSSGSGTCPLCPSFPPPRCARG